MNLRQIIFVTLCASLSFVAFAQGEKKMDVDAVKQLKIKYAALWIDATGQYSIPKLDAMSDAFASQQTLLLGSGSAGWVPGAPNWQRVFDVVSSDIRRDIKLHSNEKIGGLKKSIVESFADASSAEDLIALTKFAKSKQGKDYWRLSAEMSELLADTLTNARTGKISNDVPTISNEEVEAWKHLLKATYALGLMVAMAERNERLGRDITGYAGGGVLWGMVLSGHRKESKKLEREYSEELDVFVSFNESPLGKRHMNAMAESSDEITQNIKKYMNDFNARILSHQSSWKQMYESKAALPLSSSTHTFWVCITPAGSKYSDASKCDLGDKAEKVTDVN